jgi:hypothetical protein
MPESSCMTLPFETKSQGDNGCYSRTQPNSSGYTQPLSHPTVSKPLVNQAERQAQTKQIPSGQLPATVSTPRQAVIPSHASSSTSVAPVVPPNTVKPSVRSKVQSEKPHGSHPRYLRYNIWTDHNSSSFTPSTADWSETAPPLPSIPDHELNNPIAQKTISENPHLFNVSTPINVKVFEQLLLSHPNRPLVESVCRGLRQGFWPWADTHIGEYPDTHSEDRGPPSDPAHAAFLRTQRDTEIQKGRFSQSFGPDLLPGMYCMPIHAVPKPGSDDLRLVTNYSAGKFAVNSMIHTASIRGFPLDNMRHIGEMLLKLRRTFDTSKRFVMFKSDVAEAYRLLPMHPIWQLKQINCVDGFHNVDWRNSFGMSSAGAIFITFLSLVMWIARHVKEILDIFAYVDDCSGTEIEGEETYYKPYNKFMPSKQVALLQLWDELSIPHKESKQIYGAPLTIIGVSIDPNAMTLTLPEEARLRLLDVLRTWAAVPTSRSHGSFRLKNWQEMTGWVNWGLNVFPLLRPALNNVYPKIAGKTGSHERIWVNNAIRDDLSWAADILQDASGVRLLRSTAWDPSLADVTIYCDACLEGMGYWFPDHHVGYFSPTPPSPPVDRIFYYEALCVVAALHRAHRMSPNGSRFVIYTDNTNTVDIFNSLHCLPAYNHILRFAVDILLDGDHDLRVLHIPGEDNDVADAISREDFSRVLDLQPGLSLLDFQPPQMPLGAAKK